MFEYQPRRHPLQTFQFWFILTLCAGGVGAWRWGAFGARVDNSDSAQIVLDEPLPPPPLQIGEVHLGVRLESPRLGNSHAPPQFEADTENGQNDFSFAAPEMGSSSRFNSPPVQSAPANESNLKVATKEPAIRQLSLESPTHQAPARTAELNTTDLLSKHETQSQVPSMSRPQGRHELNLDEIDRLIDSGEDVVALRMLSTTYWQFPEQRSLMRSRLSLLSRRIYFQPQPHYMDPYEVQFGDRLELIARKYQVPWEYLAKINRVDAQKLQAGKKLKVIQGPFNIVIDLSDFEATVHAHGYFVVRMPVGIGKDGATPVGTFRVTDKVVDPIYYGPDGVIKNDDPMNPLGEYWIAISDERNTLQGYGIHGTIDPSTIGQAESRGCIRLHDQDIADLFDLLVIGSEVVIRR